MAMGSSAPAMLSRGVAPPRSHARSAPSVGWSNVTVGRSSAPSARPSRCASSTAITESSPSSNQPRSGSIGAPAGSPSTARTSRRTAGSGSPATTTSAWRDGENNGAGRRAPISPASVERLTAATIWWLTESTIDASASSAVIARTPASANSASSSGVTIPPAHGPHATDVAGRPAAASAATLASAHAFAAA